MRGGFSTHANSNHLWANRYDRELDDIFALKDEITEAIVGRIDSELRGAERDRAKHKATYNLNAWGLYQRDTGTSTG